MSGREQVSMCIRIAKNLEPAEFFLGLFEASETTGDSLAKMILDVLLRYNLPIDKLRGQCYDGAANMSGVRQGVQTIRKAKQPLVLYVHCTAHSLNLAVQSTITNIPWMRDALFLVNDIGTFIQGSSKRITLFETFQEREVCGYLVSPRPLCPMRWTVKALANSYQKKQQNAKNEQIEILYYDDNEDEHQQENTESTSAQLPLPYEVYHLSLQREIPSASGFSPQLQREIPSAPKRPKLKLEHLLMKTFLKAQQNRDKMLNQGFNMLEENLMLMLIRQEFWQYDPKMITRFGKSKENK
ncbi:hypothetical protein DMENIID0001_155520 [Sergentomyia squamirostris]